MWKGFYPAPPITMVKPQDIRRKVRDKMWKNPLDRAVDDSYY
ncbi:MAG: hypothetical protein WAP51_03805 [Candidatus Sungiibacteriota bacterium]